jgi:predicted AAA+ superfamily ATPase
VIKRLLDPFFNIHKKSFFLLGPRSVGKTFWVKRTLPKNAVYINLLKSDEYLALSSQPDLLRKLSAGKELVVIDEIQKLPILLDEVHSLIEETQTHFLLTGSSARKLKKIMQIYLVDVQGCCICTLCVLKKLKILI